MKRRDFLTALAAALGLPDWSARAQTAATDPTIRSISKGARLATGRVKLELPVIADNGNAVPLKVSVDSPMSAEDFVKVIHLVSDRNPVRHMAAFHFSPRSGRAQLSTRVRLSGSPSSSSEGSSHSVSVSARLRCAAMKMMPSARGSRACFRS